MSIPDIIAKVAFEHNLDPADIKGRSRVLKIAHARQEVMWRARQILKTDGRFRYSLPFIGKSLKRDHSTVHAGVKAHQRRCEHTENIPYHLAPATACDLPSPANHVRLDA